MLWVPKHPLFLKVWVLAPTVFSKFYHNSINLDEDNTENIKILVISWQKVIVSTRSVKFLMGTLLHKRWTGKYEQKLRREIREIDHEGERNELGLKE